MDEETTKWIEEIRRRLHDQGNQITRIEGQMTADQRIYEERFRANDSRNQEIRTELSALNTQVNSMGGTINEINTGQKALLQRMESDHAAEQRVAAAIREAEDARRRKRDEPWITPNRVIATVLGVAAILTYIGEQSGIL